MKSRAGETLLFIAGTLLVATVLMLLVHFWRLPGILAALQPLARGAIAFFLGGAALHAIKDVDDPGPAAALTRGTLRLLLVAGLLVVYLVPTYCNFRHYRNRLDASSNALLQEMAQRITFTDFLHLIGTNKPIVSEDDIPDGDDFFDLLVGIVMLVDVGVQKLFTGVFHLAVAGYVSLTLWYLMFLLFSYAGLALFYER